MAEIPIFVEVGSRAPLVAGADMQTVEIDGALVGILTRDHADRSFYFHSGVAPFDLLDGSRFVRLSEAHEAVRRMSRAARQVRSAANGVKGDER